MKLCVRLRLLRTFVYGFCARCTSLAYVYGFAFAHVVLTLRTYTAFYFAHVVQILRTHKAFVRAVRLNRTYMAYHHDVQCGQSRGIQS